MAQLSMNEMTTYRWSFEEDVENYREAGIPAIGVWRQKLSDFGEEKGVELLAESGLAVSNLLWAGGFTGSDGRGFRDSLQDAAEAIRLAGAMRCNCVVVYTGARGGHTHNHARRLTVDALRELVPLAEEFGVCLALEPMHPGCAAEWTFLTNVQDALELLDPVGSDHLRLAFDTYHYGAECSLKQIEQIAQRIAIVHLGDGRQEPRDEQNRSRLGEGAIPLKEIVSALQSGGYDGFFDVELMGEDIEADDYRDLIRHSKETFCQLMRH